MPVCHSCWRREFKVACPGAAITAALSSPHSSGKLLSPPCNNQERETKPKVCVTAALRATEDVHRRVTAQPMRRELSRAARVPRGQCEPGDPPALPQPPRAELASNYRRKGFFQHIMGEKLSKSASGRRDRQPHGVLLSCCDPETGRGGAAAGGAKSSRQSPAPGSPRPALCHHVQPCPRAVRCTVLLKVPNSFIARNLFIANAIQRLRF